MEIGNPGTMCGVNGVRGFISALNRAPGCFDRQKFFTAWKPITYYGEKAVIRATLRLDDECKNGKNSFSITGEIRKRLANGTPSMHGVNADLAGGCIHEEIAKHFPKLAHLIKWHLTDSDSPMHYIANTAYHASDRDYNGLLKGEKAPILGPDKMPTWLLVGIDDAGEEISMYDVGKLKHRGHTPPEIAPRLEWRMWTRTGEGKPRDFKAARNTAVWPEATDEQLSLPKAELIALLEARHFDLMAAFKADMLGAGFLWSPQTVDA